MAEQHSFDAMFEPGIQEEIFKKAFDYIKNKYGKVNMNNCISEMYSTELEEDYVICVTFACLSFIEMGSEDFEQIEKGLTKKMKKSIMMQAGEHFKNNN